jgi:hypothetical protein
MSPQLKNLDRKQPAELTLIREQAEAFRSLWEAQAP